MTVMLGLGLPLTKRYPAYYQRKLGLGPMPQNAHRQDRETGLESEQITKPSMNRHSRTSEGREEQKMAAPSTIVAINGSPHEGIGNTFMMIEMLRQQLSREGFELEVIHLSQ
ncbi:MAG: NAD(P)H-dependent oxidoreductase, partial [Deltaproteobacteria bacterium]|nr:NAD(P)H-dependent oxidoreductase [Deltaproteobacteria bacterium]